MESHLGPRDDPEPRFRLGQKLPELGGRHTLYSEGAIHEDGGPEAATEAAHLLSSSFLVACVVCCVDQCVALWLLHWELQQYMDSVLS